MTNIQVFESDKEKLDKIGDMLKRSFDMPLITYPEIIGYLIRKTEENIKSLDKMAEDLDKEGGDNETSSN